MKEERCSNCSYNKYNKTLKEYCCDNSCSDLYGIETQYNDSCEKWESKEHE